MSEQIHDQVSAFMDDELSGEECAFLVRRLERDPEARARLIRYSLVGTALRGELWQADPEMLRRRVHEALNGAAPPMRAVAAGAPSMRRRRWATPAFGVGIAATVAVAALVTINLVNQPGSDPAADSGLAADNGGRPGITAAATLQAPSYVVPPESQDIRVFAPPPIRLTNYLMHHGEYASRLSRTSVHSNMVGALDMPAARESFAADDESSNGERGEQ